MTATRQWGFQSLDALMELSAARDQTTLEASFSVDDIRQATSLEDVTDDLAALDIARARVGKATRGLRACGPPPDAETARHLAPMLDEFQRFATAAVFSDIVAAWVRGNEHGNNFDAALSQAIS